MGKGWQTVAMSSSTTKDLDPQGAFDARFRVICQPPLLRAEKRVLGTDFGASSFTTVAQADRLASILGLRPGMFLLDVGSGAGWPGIYLAQSTGCRAILTDLSVEGPKVSTERMEREGIDGVALSASGTHLPLRSDLVDAVTCSDVFC